jgi:hypothetical protein
MYAYTGAKEDPMESPRDMTEEQAERMLKMMQKKLLKIAKESNDLKVSALVHLFPW